MGVILWCAAGTGMKRWPTTAATRRRRGSTRTPTWATPCATSFQLRWVFHSAQRHRINIREKCNWKQFAQQLSYDGAYQRDVLARFIWIESKLSSFLAGVLHDSQCGRCWRGTIPQWPLRPHPSMVLRWHEKITLFLQNIINEKIYLAVWFWYAFLVPYAILAMFFRLFTIFFDKIRFNLIYKTVRFWVLKMKAEIVFSSDPAQIWQGYQKMPPVYLGQRTGVNHYISRG